MASSDIFWFGQAHSVKKGGRASHKGNSSEPTPVLRTTTTDFVVISMALKGPAKTWKKNDIAPKIAKNPLCHVWALESLHTLGPTPSPPLNFPTLGPPLHPCPRRVQSLDPRGSTGGRANLRSNYLKCGQLISQDPRSGGQDATCLFPPVPRK